LLNTLWSWALCDATYGAPQTPHGTTPMSELLPYWTVITAGAALGSMAYFVAYFKNLEADTPARLIGAGNENVPTSVKRAA
jgi:hypothetical protein